MKDRKIFKQLFKSNKMVSLETIYQEFGFSSEKEIVSAQKKWKIDKYFDITGTFIRRNETPTRWDNLKKGLKKAGKWGLTKCVPVAIGIATGGVGLGAVAAPAIAEIVQKLRTRGLEVSEDSQVELENILINKTDASIDALMEKLRKNNQSKGISPDKLDRLIRLSIKEDLHPLLSEIQAVLGSLQQEQEYLTSIFEDWVMEQRSYLESLQVNMKDQFDLTLESLDDIERSLNPLLEDLSEIKVNVKETNARLIAMEERLDNVFHEVCKQSFEELSLEELIQASRIQFQNMRLAGKFDKPYDARFFIETPKLIQDFTSFLKGKQDTIPVFLLLASIGMGKTWNAVHLGILARELKITIPLFIPIHMGYSSILREFFQIDRVDLSALGRIVGEKCEKIHSRLGKRVLLVLDGLDEYPDPNREPFLNFLRHLLQGYKHAVRILLTDRITDWCENKQLRSFYRDITHLIWPNTDLKGTCNLYQIATPLSGFLDGFTDSQLNQAIIQYGLEREKFPVALYTLCHRPYVLRIVYEREQYFDPANVEEFRSVFYDRLNPVNTILDRMGIINPKELLFPLFESFGIASAVKSERELKTSIIQNRTEWELILRSGLLKIEQKGYQDVFKFDSVFHPIINDYLVQIGKLSEDDLNKTAQEKEQVEIKPARSISKTEEIDVQASDDRRKCDYHMSLGEKYLYSDNYDEALTNLENAREICDKKLLDAELLLKIDGLIGQVKEKELIVAEGKKRKEAEQIKRVKEDLMKKIVSFKGNQIPQFEANFLQALESQSGKEFKRVNKIEWNTQMGFSVDNNRISGLGLYDCGLITLPESIKQLSALKILHLRKNKLSVLPESITNLNSLQILNLESNQLSNLPESMGNLISIRELNLDHNHLTSLPESVGKLENLKNLRLGSNELSSLPESIGDLNSLEILWIPLNKLNSLPESICKLTSLHTFFLLDNSLTTIPEHLDELKSLQHLSLGHNPIKRLPDSLGNLISLEKLGIGRIGLNRLPDWLFSLKNLKELTLQDNKLEEIPDSIGDLISLENLFLSRSGVKRISESIGNLKSLQRLFLDKNSLTSFPDAIGKLESLKHITAEDNKLSKLPSMIGNLKSLEVLTLSSNNLTILPKDFGNLTSLRVLRLDGNQLRSLPESIGDLSSLKKLNLRDNPLKILPVSIQNLQRYSVEIEGIDGLEYGSPKETSIELISFRGAQIPKIESEVLKLIETQTGKEFSLIDQVDSNIQIGFSVENNRINGIGLNKCEIYNLPESIRNLTSLKILIMYNSHLITLPDSIGNLSSLEILRFPLNRLKSLPKSIGNLISLQFLDLSNNQLSSLPDSIRNLSSLRKLHLSGNPLNSLPNFIADLHLLQELLFISNQLSTLPESIGKLKSLVKLVLSCGRYDKNEKLRKLPDSIGNLKSLEELSLGFLNLEALPESIGSLESLKSLDLSRNNLSILPESIGKLSSLEFLSIFGNKLLNLPDSMGQLSSLQKLDLNNNKLSKLPDSIGQLSSLQKLELAANPLTTLPDSIGNLNSLQILVLTNSRLKSLPRSIGNLKFLEELRVSNTNLTTLPESISDLSSLKLLALSKNNIKTFPEVINILEKRGVKIYL